MLRQVRGVVERYEDQDPVAGIYDASECVRWRGHRSKCLQGIDQNATIDRLTGHEGLTFVDSPCKTQMILDVQIRAKILVGTYLDQCIGKGLLYRGAV